MPHFRSTYTFSIAGTTRTFHHRWYMGGRIYECDTCNSSCDIRVAYSQHWQPTAACAHRKPSVCRPLCSAEQREQLATITARQVHTFILCNDRANTGNPNDFLVDAGINAVPQLLRLLFHDAARLYLRLGFYTRTHSDANLLFNSSELALEHHLDIGESVDVLFLMLLEKIEAYAYARYTTRAAEYCVKRIRINVRRELNTKVGGTATAAAALPLQYRVKHATAVPKQVISAKTAATANIYCFRVCARTQELYAVPYQLGKSAVGDSDVENSQPNVLRPWDTIGSGAHYIMVESVDGESQQLFEITNLCRFLRIDADIRVHTCTQCKANFTQRTKLLLHKSLNCGRDFEVLKLPSDYIEIYESCLQMRCNNYNWPLYGIIER